MEKITLESITFSDNRRSTMMKSFDISFRIAFTDKHGSAIHMLCELPCYGDYDLRDRNGSRDTNLKENKAHVKRYLLMLGVSARSIDKAMSK